MQSKVSIQIPTYNQQQYIDRAIESASSQDYPELEIIIADDCSTDDTAAVVKKHQARDSRIKYFRNETNIGRVNNYRKSLYEYCSGDWVVNLDGDDYFSRPDFISRGLELITKYRSQGHNVLFYQAAIEVVDDVTGISSPRFHHLPGDDEHIVLKNYYLDGHYRKNKFFSHLTTIYHRPTATRIGFYEFNTLNTDFESMMKLSFYGEAILDNKPAGVWRLHNSNATFNSGAASRNKEYPVFQRLYEYAKAAYGNNFSLDIQRKLRKENQILHLELLAENNGFIELIKYMVRYRIFYWRIPLLLAKGCLRNFHRHFIKSFGF